MIKHAKITIFIFVIVITLMASFFYLNHSNEMKKPVEIAQGSIHTGPVITLWFDDAWISQYKTAYPLMHKYGFVGALAVPTNYIESEGNMSFLGFSVTKADFLTWDNIHELNNHGWEIVSHTKSHHCNIDYYGTPDILKDEFLGSKEVLASKGFVANNFVMPCGTWAKKEPFLPAEAKKYYDSYRSLQPEVNPLPLYNPYDIRSFYILNDTKLSDVEKWIQMAKEQKAWLNITFHIIDNSHVKYAITPVLFEEVLDLIKKSGIPVVLPSQLIPKKENNLTKSKSEKKQ